MPRPARRRTATVTLLVAAAVAAGITGAVSPARAADTPARNCDTTAGTPPTANGSGLTVDASAAYKPCYVTGSGKRLVDLSFVTAAFQERTTGLSATTPETPRPAARILLPAGYTNPANANTYYPVLYLLHGSQDVGQASGSYRGWSDPGRGNLQALLASAGTAAPNMIVVMPEAGRYGWYSNWAHPLDGSGPDYETFHIDQLTNWVTANYRTLNTQDPNARGRAIAGLSMGGFGALSYAARHPELYVAAASFSGAIDITHNDVTTESVPNIVHLASNNATSFNDGDAIFGRYNNDFGVSEQLKWRRHNPKDLVGNLKGIRLDLFAGNQAAPGDILEGLAHDEMGVFGAAASAAGITVASTNTITSCPTPTGGANTSCGHNWNTWRASLLAYLPTLKARFAAQPAAPATWTYKSGEASYAARGWNVTTTNANGGFTTLSYDGPATFRMTGNGSASVRTAAIYTPNSVHAVTVGTGATVNRTADATGRLTVPTFRIGPDNTRPDYSFDPTDVTNPQASNPAYSTVAVTVG